MASSVDPAPVAKPNLVRRLYDWVLSWAHTPYAIPALVVLALAEASVFPIPPDVLLIALCLSLPKRGWRFAAWCTLGSVLGGLLGYAMGHGAWDLVGPFLLEHVFSRATFDLVAAKYHEHGFWAVFVAAFTPIPYKVFTVTAGVVHLPLSGFVAASVVGRGARFFLVAAVIRLTGPRAKVLLDKYFNAVTIAGTILLIGGFVLLRQLG